MRQKLCSASITWNRQLFTIRSELYCLSVVGNLTHNIVTGIVSMHLSLTLHIIDRVFYFLYASDAPAARVFSATACPDVAGSSS